jgi:hypothetical protein
MGRITALLCSRLPVIIGVFAVALLLAVSLYVRRDSHKAWHVVGVHSGSVPYADARTVTCAIDNLESGKDPYFYPDPYGRLYNYPSLWLDLRYIGLTSRTSLAFEVVLVSMFVGALLLLFRAWNLLSAGLVLAGVVSQPSLFVVERGNVDMAVFSMMIFGFILADRQRPIVKSLITRLLVAFLTCLKIYPIAALAVFLRNRKGIGTALLAGVLSVLGLLVTTGRSLPLVFANTPQVTWASYGSLPFFLVLSLHTSRWLATMVENHHLIATGGGAVIAGLSVFAGLHWRGALERFLPRLDFESVWGRIAIACLAVYCFTFLIGAEFDYRLIFLLGVLAYLVRDLEERGSLRSLPASIGLLCLLWTPITPYAFVDIATQILDGLVFALASAWLGLALLDHLGKAEVGPSPDEPQRPSDRAPSIQAHNS